jgi:hypothetical protein
MRCGSAQCQKAQGQKREGQNAARSGAPRTRNATTRRCWPPMLFWPHSVSGARRTSPRAPSFAIPRGSRFATGARRSSRRSQPTHGASRCFHRLCVSSAAQALWRNTRTGGLVAPPSRRWGTFPGGSALPGKVWGIANGEPRYGTRPLPRSTTARHRQLSGLEPLSRGRFARVALVSPSACARSAASVVCANAPHRAMPPACPTNSSPTVGLSCTPRSGPSLFAPSPSVTACPTSRWRGLAENPAHRHARWSQTRACGDG